ncbi:hypothetical protein [Xanthomonas cucurbitae]|uniref:hypothetical protein n=1 Tax=Xanthomonas cucurbitae TaxID=56453 RepID=UPI003EBAD20A
MQQLAVSGERIDGVAANARRNGDTASLPMPSITAAWRDCGMIPHAADVAM